MSSEAVEIYVHPGIGDISWVYSKLCNQQRPLNLRIALDSKTTRAIPYVSILPRVSIATYAPEIAYYHLARCQNGTWEQLIEGEAAGKKLFVSANNWLEAGNRLEEFLPDLPTDHHYALSISDEAKRWARAALPSGALYVGIYTSSLEGIHMWDGWRPGEWHAFCSSIHDAFPHVVFVLMGAKWDKDLAKLTRRLLVGSGMEVVNLVGKTRKFERVVALLGRLRYFAGYASGLGVMATVVGTPSAMFYPWYLEKLTWAWPPLEQLVSRAHQGMVWPRPVDAFRKVNLALEAALDA